jgi:hypothetical protein
MGRSTVKRGRAVKLSATLTTLKHIEIEDGHLEVKSTVSNVLPRDTELNIVDLFDIGANTEKGRINETKPFRHRVHFYGPHGKKVRVWANIDNGAMREVMSSTTFEKVKHRLGMVKPSTQLLQVANRVIVRSKARWEGEIEVNGVRTNVGFEVFDSGGRWDFLFGNRDKHG